MGLINGRPDQHPLLANRGLAYGDGVFETIAWVNGEPRYWEYHMERLARGCKRLLMPVPERSLLEQECASLAAPSSRTVIKVIITRGAGGRGYAPAPNAEPVRIVEAFQWPDGYDVFSRDGVRTIRCETTAAFSPALAGIKHLNRLEQVLASAEVLRAAVDEGFICDPDGNLIGGTKTNVFLIEQGKLLTPRLDRCGIEGVQRRVVMETAAILGIEVAEQRLPFERVLSAQEVFVCNAIAGVWPVRLVAGDRGAEFATGPLTKTLIEHLML